MLTVKCQGDFKIFQFALAIHRQKKDKKKLKTQQKPLNITSAMALAYLYILPRALTSVF